MKSGCCDMKMPFCGMKTHGYGGKKQAATKRDSLFFM